MSSTIEVLGKDVLPYKHGIVHERYGATTVLEVVHKRWSDDRKTVFVGFENHTFGELVAEDLYQVVPVSLGPARSGSYWEKRDRELAAREEAFQAERTKVKPTPLREALKQLVASLQEQRRPLGGDGLDCIKRELYDGVIDDLIGVLEHPDV